MVNVQWNTRHLSPYKCFPDHLNLNEQCLKIISQIVQEISFLVESLQNTIQTVAIYIQSPFFTFGPALLQMQVSACPIFYFCSTWAGHIKECRRCQRWGYVYSVILWCSVWLWDEEEWKWKPVLAFAHSYWKAPRGPLGLTSSSDEWITINNTYAFTTKTLQVDLGFNQGIN